MRCPLRAATSRRSLIHVKRSPIFGTTPSAPSQRRGSVAHSDRARRAFVAVAPDSAAEIGLRQLGPPQLGSGEQGALQIGAAEIGPEEFGLHQIGALEV